MHCLYLLLAIFCYSALAAPPPYGQLSVSGTKLKRSKGQNVALRGMSLYWSQWKGQFYNAEVIKALKCSWNTNVFRAAMAVDNGGYLTNPSAELAKITTVVQAAIDLGMYVIIDWHTDKYAGVPNVLYEIYNEPVHMSWTNELVPYHTAVIKAIRKYDTKNIIIVGTPLWSQDVDVASKNPIQNQTNIMYTLHYYAGEHKQWLRDKAQTALNNGLPIFITEYGTTNLQAKGSVDANWGMDDVDENTAAVAVGTPTTLAAISSDASLTTSGKLVKAHYNAQNNGVSCTVTSKATTKSNATTTKASAATTKAAISNNKLTVVPVISKNWSGGFQVDFVFTNNDSKAICSAIFTYALKSGQVLNSSWNMEAGSSSSQFKLPSWTNIPGGSKYKDTGISINGSNSTLPSVSCISYAYC
uniref:Endoglucanase n=1 Tax=Ditylenchus dipsaci TaxID=166011 RepID=A0A915E588_9BILA